MYPTTCCPQRCLSRKFEAYKEWYGLHLIKCIRREHNLFYLLGILGPHLSYRRKGLERGFLQHSEIKHNWEIAFSMGIPESSLGYRIPGTAHTQIFWFLYKMKVSHQFFFSKKRNQFNSIVPKRRRHIRQGIYNMLWCSLWPIRSVKGSLRQLRVLYMEKERYVSKHNLRWHS